MAAYNIPSAPTVYKSRYEGFSGCDFNTDPMRVADNRFPYAQNLTLDTNGYPEKRPGYKEVLSFGGKVNKLFRAVVSSETLLLVHADNKISVYTVSDGNISDTACLTEENVKKCFFVAWNDAVYVYGADTDDKGFVKKLEKDGETFLFADAVPDAYAPYTSIAGNVLTESEYERMISLGNASAGGQFYEDVNLVGRKRVNTFKLNEYETVRDEAAKDDADKLCFPEHLSLVPDSNCYSKDLYDAMYGLYLRMYCVEPDDYVYYDSHKLSSTYSDEWKLLYGTDAEAKYTSFVEQITKKDETNVKKHILENGGHYLYRGRYAEALYSYLSDTGVFWFEHDGEDFSAVYLKDASGMKLEAFDENSGWTDFPLCVKSVANISQGTDNVTLFYSFFDFGSFEDFSDDFEEKLLRRIRLKRIGAYRYSASAGMYSFKVTPDINADVNFRLAFYVPDKTFNEGLNKIVFADTSRLYGVGGVSDRVFINGVGDEKHYVRFSEMDNPLYFPDLNYITLGTPSTKVIDMFMFSSYLCVAKEQNFQDVNLFLVEGTMNSGEAVFLVKEGIPGIGLKETGAFASVDDVPHFLSDNGVFYLTSVDITAKSTVKNCSYFADSMIGKENHQGARLFYYKKKLLLSFPESKRVYVFNTNDKAYSKFAGTDHYVYETWLWTDIEAADFISFSDVLYFVTKDGKLMRFKEHGTINCYSDEHDGESHPIDAYFMTKAFDDGSFMTLKNMRKRGCGVALKPFVRSSATVYVITDRDEHFLKDVSADIFDWEYIDFCRVEFTANPAIRIMPFNTKVKKYATIQFYVRNNEVGESFGVIGLEKAYTFGNYKKN